eukprot:Nk52_evm5s384 gene=Nk52_evmTU5s384
MTTRDERKYGDDIPQLEGISPAVKTLIRNLFRVRILKVSGYIALVLGALLIVAAAVVPFIIHDQINKEVVRKLTVDCTCHSEYNDWLKDDNTRRSFTFFNLTNADQVIGGFEKPKLDKKGPYTYQLEREYIDVEFRTQGWTPVEAGQSGSLVTFKEWNMYKWEAENSCSACSPSDSITTINQAYLGALQLVGGTDFGVFYGFIDGIVKSLTTYTGPASFLGQTYIAATPAAVFNGQALPNNPNNLLRSIVRDAAVSIMRKNTGNFTVGEPIDLDAALYQWMECKSLVGPVSVPGFEIAYNASTKSCTPLGIDISTARRLFNTDGSKSPFALTNGSGYLLWFNQTNAAKIMSDFKIDEGVYARVAQWFAPTGEFGNSTIKNAFLGGLNNEKIEYGVTSNVTNPLEQGMNLAAAGFGYEKTASEYDLGLLQWSSSFVTCGLRIVASGGVGKSCSSSIASSDPTLPVVEFSAWATLKKVDFGNGVCDMEAMKKENYNILPSLYGGQTSDNYFGKVSKCQFFTLEQSRAIWSKTTGLGNALVLGQFLALAETGAWPETLLNALKISKIQAVRLAQYLSDAKDMGYAALGMGKCGLFCTKSVDQWLFGMPDPFLLALTGSEALSFQSYFPNITNIDDARKYVNESTWGTGLTGKRDLQVYRAWNQTDSISQGAALVAGLPWASAEIISGTDGTQFEVCDASDSTDCKNDRLGEKMAVYEENLMRTLIVQNDGTRRSIKGVTTLPLRLAPEALQSKDTNPANVKYFMDYTGIAPMKTAKGGVDMCFSKPFFLDADQVWSTHLQDFPYYTREANPTEYDQYDTILDMEPISGKVVNANKQLQINYNITSASTQTFYPNMSTGYLFPSFFLNENGIITDSDASSLRSDIYGNQDLATNFMIAGFVVGGVVFVAGIICIIVAYRMKKKYVNGNELLLAKHKLGSSSSAQIGQTSTDFVDSKTGEPNKAVSDAA